MCDISERRKAIRKDTYYRWCSYSFCQILRFILTSKTRSLWAFDWRNFQISQRSLSTFLFNVHSRWISSWSTERCPKLLNFQLLLPIKQRLYVLLLLRHLETIKHHLAKSYCDHLQIAEVIWGINAIQLFQRCKTGKLWHLAHESSFFRAK